MDKKARRKFWVLGDNYAIIGYGLFYPYGANVQVYFAEHGYAAWQMHSLSEVMLYEGVRGIQWHD